jgi:hypothetical protein
MPTIEDVAKQPLEQRLARMARTAAERGDAIDGRSEAILVRRPDLRNWAAKEITLLGPPRDDRGDGRAGVRGGGAGCAGIALTPAQWQRGGVHPTRGRMTVEDFVTMIAWHDDNHLDQLRRALDGKV